MTQEKEQQTNLINPFHGTAHIDDTHVPFKLRKNPRIKSTRLLISESEGLVVESPKTITLKWALKLIKTRKNWILESMSSIAIKRKRAETIKKHQNSVLIYGQEKIIEIRTNQAKDYILESSAKIILGFKAKTLSAGQVNNKLNIWLKEKANRYLNLVVCKFANDQFSVNRVTIKDQKTLWGSCSESNNINLNWRLVMAPTFASDYIIMHELCHMLHMNHSPKFWAAVSKICPDYKQAESWFEEFGFVLHFEFDF